METDRAETLLQKGKYSVKTITLELFELLYSSRMVLSGSIEDVYVTASADFIEQEKAKVLEEIQDSWDDDSLYFVPKCEISQMTYNFGDFKMESIFSSTKWPQLGHPESEEGGNEYQGLFYLEVLQCFGRRIMRDGRGG